MVNTKEKTIVRQTVREQPIQKGNFFTNYVKKKWEIHKLRKEALRLEIRADGYDERDLGGYRLDDLLNAAKLRMKAGDSEEARNDIRKARNRYITVDVRKPTLDELVDACNYWGDYKLFLMDAVVSITSNAGKKYAAHLGDDFEKDDARPKIRSVEFLPTQETDMADLTSVSNALAGKLNAVKEDTNAGVGINFKLNLQEAQTITHTFEAINSLYPPTKLEYAVIRVPEGFKHLTKALHNKTKVCNGG